MYKEQYQTLEWFNKKQMIIQKDNFTCQSCKKFDPSLGTVAVFNPKENDLEFHRYDSNSSIYYLTSQKHGMALKINFHFGTWLKRPILQVHHKRYIESLKVWDYEDNDLTTLCKSCHSEEHRNKTIEIFNLNGELITQKHYEPIDDDEQSSPNIRPWVFYSGNRDNYQISDVLPFVGYFVQEKDLNRFEEMRKIANEMVEYFFERFLPDYSKKTNNT